MWARKRYSSIIRIGYKVIGVDISKVGISQMLSVSKKEGLGINGIIADIYSYPIYALIDIVLLDSYFISTNLIDKRRLIFN